MPTLPTFDTPGPITATIDIGVGHVRIVASDRSDTVVDVRPTDPSRDADVRAAEQSRVEYANGQLTVTAPNKKKWRTRSSGSIDLTIDLPSDSRVDANVWTEVRSEGRLGESTVHTAAGHVRLDENGRLKVRTAAGDVAVTRSSGPADVKTSSGKIRIDEVEGAAVVWTSNGDITLGTVTGDASLSTANGDITIDRALASVEAKTAYGAVRIGEVVRGSIGLQTAFGELWVGVREGTAAWLDVSSGFGSVQSHLDATDAPEPSDETVEIRGRTGWGDIVIRRAAPVPTPEPTPMPAPTPE
jgi:Putative adhesin